MPFSLINSMEITSYVFSFRMVFFYLVTMGWIFDISLCENSKKKEKRRVLNLNRDRKNGRREPGRDGNILSNHGQDSNITAGGIDNLAG